MSQKGIYVIVLFEDGLQIVPDTWLNKDLNIAKWPPFISNQRYDKAVKNMEEPQSTWMEHPILQTFGTYTNYELARRKLKEAEEISDLDSCTEQEEYLKKSRKHRAAKVVDNSSSHDEDEELEMSDFVLNLPKVPSNCSRNEIETETLKKKIDSRTKKCQVRKK